jgi:hypothetical protein
VPARARAETTDLFEHLRAMSGLRAVDGAAPARGAASCRITDRRPAAFQGDSGA